MMATAIRGQSPKNLMTARDLLETWALRLEAEQTRVSGTALDQPINQVAGRLVHTIGTLHLYELTLPQGSSIEHDIPFSIIPPDDMEPTEGIVLSGQGNMALVQTFDTIGQSCVEATVVPDRAGLLATSVKRLRNMLAQPDAYRLGPADRLAPLLEATTGAEELSGSGTKSSILTTAWADELSVRRQRLAVLAIELIRANKRILVVCPDHQAADVLVGTIARAMKAVGLTYKTWLSRYEMSLAQQAEGVGIQELGFEAQMHQFYAKSRAEKAALRRKYDRFRELTPILAYKRQKQKDLDEVRLLEWRLLTQHGDLQAKINEVNATLAEYESLPLFKRLSLQVVGKNVESLHQYLELYESQCAELKGELDIATVRIDVLVPEAAIPKDMRPEFDELKEEIVRLGGTKKIRELLAAEDNTNRQAFIQNRRLVVTTASRVLNDPLFHRVRFDILIADEAPWIAAAPLLGAAGLVHERIVISGDRRDIASAGLWASRESAHRQSKPLA
ncbi:MAG: AAA domain-containing protein [Nitrospirota bacterium]|nr:AAA domain-containing protein [Nitrospirota bacterium]